jgi:lysophospholipase L1-like esterase
MRLLIVLFALLCPLLGETPELNWIAPTDARMEINGLAWFAENGGEWFRLPIRLKETLPPAVWNLGRSPSGARVRFRTDSNVLAVRVEYASAPDMANMHAFGQTGVDVYLDGIYRGTAIAKKDSKTGEPVEHVYFDLGSRPRVERAVTLYLPLYKAAKLLAIGVDKPAQIRRAAPYALPRPVVFYGTSITQGGCASRPGMSYQAILSRMLNLDIVNLGFSGNGKGEPEVARMVAEIDAAAFVMDFAQNNKTVESVREVYEPFLNTIREKHPTTPIFVITPISSAREALADHAGRLEAMREHIRQVASKRIAAGDKRIQIVEGTDLIGPDRLEGFVDTVHPNDLGFQWMAEGLARRLIKLR